MDIIEWHLPDRVMRQFGFRQYIPVHCDTRADLHSLDRRGRRGFDWTHHHFIFIQAWDMRHESIMDGIPCDETMRDDDLYMMWYHQITRRWVAPVEHVPAEGYQPSAAVTLDLASRARAIYYRAGEIRRRRADRDFVDQAVDDIFSWAGTGVDIFLASQLRPADEEAPAEEDVIPDDHPDRPARGRGRRAHGPRRHRVQEGSQAFTRTARQYVDPIPEPSRYDPEDEPPTFQYEDPMFDPLSTFEDPFDGLVTQQPLTGSSAQPYEFGAGPSHPWTYTTPAPAPAQPDLYRDSAPGAPPQSRRTVLAHTPVPYQEAESSSESETELPPPVQGRPARTRRRPRCGTGSHLYHGR